MATKNAPVETLEGVIDSAIDTITEAAIEVVETVTDVAEDIIDAVVEQVEEVTEEAIHDALVALRTLIDGSSIVLKSKVKAFIDDIEQAVRVK